MPEIQIRPITTADIESFADALRAVVMERQFLATTTPPMPKQIFDFVSRNIDRGYPQLIAVESGQVIGWCDTIAQGPTECSHVAKMGMGVLAEYRGQGIGRKLIRQCLDLAVEFGFEKIELEVYDDNHKARNLYIAHGFEVEGTRRKSRKLDGRYQDIIIMGKFLSGVYGEVKLTDAGR